MPSSLSKEDRIPSYEKATTVGVDANILFNLSPVAAAILSPTFQIERASRGFLDSLNLQADQCVGHDILSIIGTHISLQENDRALIRGALQTAASQRSIQTLSGRSSEDTEIWSSRIVSIFDSASLLSLLFEWEQTPNPVPAAAASPPSIIPTPPAVPQTTENAIAAAAYLDAKTSSPVIEAPGWPLVVPKSESGLAADEPFRILVQTLTDYAVFFLDTNGNIVTWNAGAELNKGYTAEEVIGKHFSIFHGHEDVADGKPQRILEECLANGRFEDDGWRFRKDGTKFWANVTITALYKNGRHVGFGKVTRNMTERRAAELRVVAAYEESAKLKSDFLANMSHEIRTPMHGMLSACSLLLDMSLTPEQRETASIIDESGQVLLRVINDILDYSKLSSGSFSIHTDIVGVASIMASVIRSVQTTIHPNVRLQLSLANNLPRAVQGDPLRYRQIIQNIVGNATKFTSKGYIRVEATVQSQDAETYVILTRVTDSGIGIPENAIPSLFLPFTQVDHTLEKRFPGAGLGLSICKSLVALMGGEIGYEPNPEQQGSIFWFTARFLKIRSLSQLSKPDSEVTAERIRRRRTLSPMRLRLPRFEPEKRQSISPPLDSIAKKRGLSKAEVAAGAVIDTVVDGSALATSPLEESMSTSSSTPATTPSSDLTPLSPPTLAESLQPLLESIKATSSPPPLETDNGEGTRNDQAAALPPSEAQKPTSPSPALFLLPGQVHIRPSMARSPRSSRSSSSDDITEDNAKRRQQEYEASLDFLRARAPGKRLLIAEDNLVNQRVLLSFLRVFGFDRDQIVLASNGSEAIDRAREQPTSFDLCLMDVNMPVVDGHKATVQIRESGIAVPIIAMTAHALKGDREQCLACGMDDYISKPVDKRVLVDKLLAYLAE